MLICVKFYVKSDQYVQYEEEWIDIGNRFS